MKRWLFQFSLSLTCFLIILRTFEHASGSTFPKPGQTVEVHYIGTLENGKVFDSSRERNQPFRFVLGRGQVIKGWEENIPKMSIGQRVKLTCTSDYGYGKKGHPGVYVLVFIVPLVDIELEDNKQFFSNIPRMMK